MVFTSISVNSRTVSGKEANGEDIQAMWKNIAEFGEGKSKLYPTGLIELLVATAPPDIEG